MTKQLQAAVAMMLILGSVTMPAQTAAKTTKKPVKKAVESSTERQIRELREEMRSQQAQIDALKTQNAEKDAKLAAAAQDAQAANTAAASATAQTQSVSSSVQANTDAVTGLKTTVSDLQTANSGLAQTISDTKKDLSEKVDSPTSLHYKGVTITPGGFFAFEGVYRTRSINSEINTPFNTTPYPGAAQAHTSELNFSGRPTRPILLIESNAGPFRMRGYFEADFQSSGTTSNDNGSNSYTLRQRQMWGQVETNSGFVMTGGQMWSLVTETKKSTDNRTENTPLGIDHQYNVGFSWARQGSIRLQQRFGNGLTVAGSLEEAQNIFSATNQNTNFFFGAPGTGGGLLNATANYSNNIAPDVVVKVTYDSKRAHLEAGGLGRFFRDRYYPNQTLATPSATGAKNDTKVAGGLFGNVRFSATKYADIGFHFLGGSGVGRYGTSSLPDTTVHPDGTLAPIKGYQALYSMEFHPTKNLDVFGYAGGEYAQRTVYLSTLGSSAGKLIGYAPQTSSNAGCYTETLPSANSGYGPGTPANCLGATRFIMEGTTGFVYRAYNSPRYGRMQYTVQYSYLTKTAWAGVGGTPTANNNMVFTSMRYYLP
ncbi:MAG TPA: hypothetical protein VGC07_09070 [Granulicella sp.]